MKKSLLLFVFFFSFVLINGQSDKTKEELKNLKGDVVKITIETDEGSVELTGEDAETVFKKITPQKKVITKNLESKKTFSFSSNGANVSINVDFEENDGEQTIRIEKEVDGKKTITVYTGDKIEDLISDIIEEMDIDITVDSSEDKETMKQNVNVEINDGEKRVTITTTKNGEKEVEVYEGEEADKILNNMKNEDEITISISNDDGKPKVKKRVIIITEDDDDK